MHITRADDLVCMTPATGGEYLVFVVDSFCARNADNIGIEDGYGYYSEKS